MSNVPTENKAAAIFEAFHRLADEAADVGAHHDAARIMLAANEFAALRAQVGDAEATRAFLTALRERLDNQPSQVILSFDQALYMGPFGYPLHEPETVQADAARDAHRMLCGFIYAAVLFGAVASVFAIVAYHVAHAVAGGL